MKKYLYVLGGWLMVFFAGQTAYAQETCYEYYENTDFTNDSIFTGYEERLSFSSVDDAGNIAFITLTSVEDYSGPKPVGSYFHYYDRETNSIVTRYLLNESNRVRNFYITRNGKYVLMYFTPNNSSSLSAGFILYDIINDTLKEITLDHAWCDKSNEPNGSCELFQPYSIPRRGFKVSEDGKYVSYITTTGLSAANFTSQKDHYITLHLLNLETNNSTVIDQVLISEAYHPSHQRSNWLYLNYLVNSIVSNDGQYIYYNWPATDQDFDRSISDYDMQMIRYDIEAGAKTNLFSYVTSRHYTNTSMISPNAITSRNDRYIVFNTVAPNDGSGNYLLYKRYDIVTGQVLDFTVSFYDVSNEGEILAHILPEQTLDIYNIEKDTRNYAFSEPFSTLLPPQALLPDGSVISYLSNTTLLGSDNNPIGFYRVFPNCEQSTGNSAYPYYAFYQDELYNTFNETDATAGKYTDYSGQQTTLTVTGNITPAPNRFGKDSAAVHIEGLGSRLSLDGGTLNPGSGNANTSLANASLANPTNARVTTDETDPTLVGQPVTIAVWFKMDNFNYGESANRILDKTGGTLLRNNEGNEYYLNIAYDDDNPEPRLHFACMDALGGVRELTSSQEVVAGEWQLALIEKNENNTIKIYHNGAPVGILTGARIRGNLEPLDIGGHASEFESWQFEGDIDDLFIQPRILTNCEKDALWSARPAQLSGTPPTYEANPQKRIAQYTFTEGSLEDAMGNYPATNQGAVPTEDKFIQEEQAMRFEGNGSLTTSIDFDGTRNNYSASVWFKAESTLIGNLLKIEGNGYEWRLSLEDNQLVFYQNGSCKQSGLGSTHTPESELLQAGRWYHLIASFDFESQVKTIYLSDGEEEVNLGLETTVVTELSDLYIDRMPKGTLTIGESFRGTLDNVQLFGKVLDYCEMRQIFIQERFAFQHPADQNRGTEGLVAHYPMIDDLELIGHALDNVPYTQYVAQADISGNTQHLSILNEDLTRGATEALPGHGLQPGQAIRYLFSDIRFAVPSEVASLKQDSAAISLWFKPTELGATQTLLDKTEGVGNEGSEYRIQLQPDGHLRLAYFTEYVEEACGGYEESVSDVSVNVNEWYHLVVIKSNNN
ncbi:MAG: LamG-like jellyroll fold domain-containing protein, partial [Bacteroidota bacterium]